MLSKIRIGVTDFFIRKQHQICCIWSFNRRRKRQLHNHKQHRRMRLCTSSSLTTYTSQKHNKLTPTTKKRRRWNQLFEQKIEDSVLEGFLLVTFSAVVGYSNTLHIFTLNKQHSKTQYIQLPDLSKNKQIDKCTTDNNKNNI